MSPSASWSLWCALCAYTITFYTLLAINFGDGSWGLTGWYVPDGVTHYMSATLQAKESFISILFDSPAGAVLLITNILLVASSALSPMLFNILCVIQSLGMLNHNGWIWPYALFFFLPYYIVASPLPSKDIFVLLIFCLCWIVYNKKSSLLKSVKLIFLCLLMFFVRDGFSVILMITFFLLYLQEKLRINNILLLLGVFIFCSLFWSVFEKIFENSFIYARSVGVASESNVLDPNEMLTFAGYVTRIFGNATNLAFRSPLLDLGGHLNLLSFSYWISGLTLLCFLTCCVLSISSKNTYDRFLSTFGLTILLFISVTPYVQPRYLLPLCVIIPSFSYITPKSFLSLIILSFVVSIVASYLYVLLGNYPPPPEPVLFQLM